VIHMPLVALHICWVNAEKRELLFGFQLGDITISSCIEDQAIHSNKRVVSYVCRSMNLHVMRLTLLPTYMANPFLNAILATVKRAIDLVGGPVILVGHSYGGEQCQLQIIANG
jgi:hypothetical protein